MAEHAAPPEDFRSLSVIPTRDEIITDQRPFLRPNKVEGRYDNKEQYLDVQFRLLREDFVKPLRDGIQQLWVKGKHRTRKEDQSLDVRVYDNVEVLNSVFKSNGVAYQIRFDVSKFRGVQWENSKRLIFGSLLCLSKDNFESFAFATVANRELSDIRRGIIEVRFVSPSCEERLRTGDKCQMVESVAFFEAYRPVLEGLQTMSCLEFPFEKYIVECQNELLPPSYLTKYDGDHVKFDFSPIIARNNGLAKSGSGSEVTVLDPASWPSAQDMGLDHSQFKALQLALTKEFAVIQGPPGTGKTYIGLKIAKILLHNKSAWRETSRTGPILVVCYTNHALDQFLEEIYEFHDEGIVRVGGRSQSEAMKKCSLSKTKQRMLKERKMPRGLMQRYATVKDTIERLLRRFQSHSKMIERLKINIINEENLRFSTSWTQRHYRNLKSRMKGSKSVMSHWLGVPEEPFDLYKGVFCKPLLMFPFNNACLNKEYFSQKPLAFMSPGLRLAPGADGSPGGSIELCGHLNSFIEIPNFECGYADAGRSITILAFVYPTGGCGPIICYEVHGYGLQIWCEQAGVNNGIGTLTACFVRRDLAVALSIRKTVLQINTWNYIGVSYDHSSGMARLWHNGNEVKATFIGVNFSLATQFPIRIGALAKPWQNAFFTGRISHLHIYSEALGIENIRAVGCISQTRECKPQVGPAGKEELDKSIIASEGFDDYEEAEVDTSGKAQRVPDVRFEAYAIQDQRILDSDDDVIRFNDRLREEEQVLAEPRGGWKFQNPSRERQKIKKIIRRELGKEDFMSEEEASKVDDVWNLAMENRWRLYRRWVNDALKNCYRSITELQETFETETSNLTRLKEEEDLYVLKNADVIGMTTTGAARYQNVLRKIQPAITIVEEAAEVLEAHIITSLTPGCKHLILIGDHQQLRPDPTVYDLQINFNFDVSLFERMIKNGLEFARLCLQHRMRPEIAKMLDHIYVDPKLENHDSVLSFESIKGVERNLFFVEHNEQEDFVAEGKSRSNIHEAKFMTALCRYLIQQGYTQGQITILAAYTGQLSKLKHEMSSKKEDLFEGVRVTVVDNFQGEENDIILLSLVRSDKSGFLKIANRVCVALSRARKGFFIIGNATLLARESPLWKNIFEDMREQGTMGRELKLTCQNHPENVIKVSRAEDFDGVPEGRCMKPCGKELECGHTCARECHVIDREHEGKFRCKRPCSKIICALGHKCPKWCGDACGPCKRRCSSKLRCGHRCTGDCRRCQQGRLHLPCNSKCDRILVCGHTCRADCSRVCPPCSEKCENYCDHRICTRNCGDLCEPCEEKCSWQCPHHKCTNPCSDPCNRPRCDEPCKMKLPCGHLCVGVCGEKCLKLCRGCNEDADCFKGCDPRAMFVELVDCGHVFEVNAMDRFMDQREAEVGQNGEVEIKHKKCPKCSKLILSSRRYGKIIKQILVDFDAVKRKILISDVADSGQIKKILNQVQEIREFRKNAEKIAQGITEGRVISEELIKRQNQVIFLKFLDAMYSLSKMNKDNALISKIHGLESRITKEVHCFSEQEIVELVDELSRVKLLVCFKDLMTGLEQKSITLSPEDNAFIISMQVALESGKKISRKRKKDFMADVKRITQKHKLLDTGIIDSELDLTGMIIRPKNMTKGPWYKCIKDHVYSVSDRIDNGNANSCSHCLEEPNGTSRTQAQTVSPQVTLRKMRTMASEPGAI
ncbi:NFX1-type zinc finger-containing protein 1-like [Montipora foliosa]|uniref:NFX1-type zinc finger-containing protein 1-like n=1 Tax=Montipora foliosa TaxID=591990 RepID=UPI0035F2069F